MASKRLADTSCPKWEREYLEKSLTFPENARTPTKPALQTAEAACRLKQGETGVCQKGVYPQGYKILDLEWWARHSAGQEKVPGIPCICALCHDDYKGTSCLLQHDHQFNSHSAQGRKKHAEAVGRATRALESRVSAQKKPATEKKSAATTRIQKHPAQRSSASSYSSRPKLTSGADFRQKIASGPQCRPHSSSSEATPCLDAGAYRGRHCHLEERHVA